MCFPSFSLSLSLCLSPHHPFSGRTGQREKSSWTKLLSLGWTLQSWGASSLPPGGRWRLPWWRPSQLHSVVASGLTCDCDWCLVPPADSNVHLAITHFVTFVLSTPNSGESLPWLEKDVFLELSESHSPNPESTRVISFSSLDFPDRTLSSGMSSRLERSRDLLVRLFAFIKYYFEVNIQWFILYTLSMTNSSADDWDIVSIVDCDLHQL